MAAEDCDPALLPLGRVLLAALERYAHEKGWDGMGRLRPEVAAVMADVLTGRAPKALPGPKPRPRYLDE